MSSRNRTISNSVNWSAATSIDHLTALSITGEPFARHTSIICTLGPSSQSVDVLVDLINAGMNIARLNFSHGSHDYHLQSIKNVRLAEKICQTSRPVAIALDTKGPEIRTGQLRDTTDSMDLMKLVTGDTITLTTDKVYELESDVGHVYVTYERMHKLIKPGQHVFIDDGLICLEVERVVGQNIVCKIINGGRLGSRKGVNLPDCAIDLPSVSEKDIDDLKFGLQYGIDMIFASFIRSADAVMEIREILGRKGSHIKIISKLENQQGIHNIDAIIRESDGIMVARGDLGIEIPAPKVFVAQKIIVSKCNLAGKPAICATQMLESMTENPRATRAEVSDVANAVLDGADCIMLSGETAKGKYPVQCVKLMNAIARQAESCTFYKERFLALSLHAVAPIPAAHAAAIAAVEASYKLHAPIIVVLTSTGNSARLISKYQPRSIIMVVTRIATTARCLNLHRGCHSVLIDAVSEAGGLSSRVGPLETVMEERELLSCEQYQEINEKLVVFQNQMNIDQWLMDIEKRLGIAMKVAKQCGYVSADDAVVCVTGWRMGSGSTNTVRILYCT